MKRTLITSALPYANGYLHLGHCAGAYLPADIYARYRRLSGDDIIWVCGSDEHGVAITIAADKEKVKPKDIIDKYHTANSGAFERFGMSFDIYSRTSNELHHGTAREFFTDLLGKGYLIEKEEEQYYDEEAKMFLPDRYVEGECPNCKKEGARGDQCDNCGAYYNQTELINPKSLVSGKKPVAKKTTHWYLQFGKFQEFLEGYIEGHSKDWKDNVLQQTRSWLKQGLSERAITRDLLWGVSIDDIDGVSKEKAAGKVLYVWFEAVLGYISATKELMKARGNEEDWTKWWQDEATRYIAFIGKDNIVFHTLIFPALLHAKGGYILPDNVPANEFLNLEGQKFSKSRNWSIDLQEFIDDFPDTQDIDTLRYTLAMNFPESKDSDFTWKDFQARKNNELASILGNFVNRTIQFLHKNFEGKVPVLPESYKDFKARWEQLIDNLDKGKGTEGLDLLDENDSAVITALWTARKKVADNYNIFRFRDGLTESMNLARAANKYFNDEEPWKAVKNDPDKCAKALYVCTQLVRSISVLFAPVIPFTCEKISDIAGSSSNTGAVNPAGNYTDVWQEFVYPSLEEGTELKKPDILFTRLEDKTVEAQVEKLGSKGPAEEEELIGIEDFTKVKLRTAKIVEAEKLKKSKKLLKLIVDLGDEKRQILAGVADYYSPEELIGKTVVVVANLKPAKLMGTESQGMMLAASNADGKLCFVTVEKEDIGPGAEIR